MTIWVLFQKASKGYNTIMEIPYAFFLLLYALGFLAVLIFTSFNLYHAVRYALRSVVSISVTGFFIIGLIVMIGVSLVYITGQDWGRTFLVTIGI